MRKELADHYDIPRSTRELYELSCQLVRTGYDPRINARSCTSFFNYIPGKFLRVTDYAVISLAKSAKQPKRDDLTLLLFKLGERVERAELAHDFDAIIAIDKQIEKVINDNPDVWCAMWIIKGQNNIRRARGLHDLDL